ncbi:hypothetical protein BV96_01118 [Sphingomonas paucimobilis]|nr:hypothetical protein BV96_01118 [Sphingomonas paucimobilis]
MWKFEVGDISEFHYRQLRLLVKMGRAEAHIVVQKRKLTWPRTADISDRKANAIPVGNAIN